MSGVVWSLEVMGTIIINHTIKSLFREKGFFPLYCNVLENEGEGIRSMK